MRANPAPPDSTCHTTKQPSLPHAIAGASAGMRSSEIMETSPRTRSSRCGFLLSSSPFSASASGTRIRMIECVFSRSFSSLYATMSVFAETAMLGYFTRWAPNFDFCGAT